MSNQLKAYIAGVGMITPVGANAKMTAAAVKAGISQCAETEFFDQNYEPIRMALVPDEVLRVNLETLPPTQAMSAKEARLLQLAGTACQELLPLLPNGEKLALFVAGPEQIDSTQSRLTTSFLKNLSQQSNIEIDLDSSRCVSLGRAGGIYALDAALRYLESNKKQYALVGGVDSFYDLAVIDYYIDKDRILTAASMEGFIPGEAAGFLLLKSLNHTNSASVSEAMACVFEPGIHQERGHLLSNEPYKGEGLSSAFSKALQEVQSNNIRNIYSAMNGEAYFAKEFGVAMLRNKKFIHDDCVTYHPADCFGDIGAAAGTVLTGLASLDIESKCNCGSYLVYSSSDSEFRGAVRVGLASR